MAAVILSMDTIAKTNQALRILACLEIHRRSAANDELVKQAERRFLRTWAAIIRLRIEEGVMSGREVAVKSTRPSLSARTDGG